MIYNHIKKFTRFVPSINLPEKILITLWVIGIFIILNTQSGTIEFLSIFKNYLKFFSINLIYLFFFTRIIFLADKTRITSNKKFEQRLKFWITGTGAGFKHYWIDNLFNRDKTTLKTTILDTDIAFIRGFLLFNFNLIIYSNLKYKLPYFNSLTTGDAFFSKLDNIIFGHNFINRIEHWFSANHDVALYFQKVYMHDYIWFVILLAIFYIRKDVHSIRWAFSAISLTYILGILITALYPSAGPCFMHPQKFEWLSNFHIGKAQNGLWNAYIYSQKTMAETGIVKAKAFAGIAAFPSLHVAHMVLVFWIAIKKVPALAIWMFWVTIATFIATIGFGWHYAVDGIAGAFIAVVVTELTYRLQNKTF